MSIGLKLGLLFGSFDPIHNGHLAMLKQALHAGACDEILVVVQPFNAYKSTAPAASLPDRMAMAKLAINGLRGVTVAELDMDIAVAHSVAATLKELKRQDNERVLVLIVGQDLARTLPEWGDYDEILRLARLFEVPRDEKAVSSELVRGLVSQGKPIEGLVPSEVAEYIFEHGLYQND